MTTKYKENMNETVFLEDVSTLKEEFDDTDYLHLDNKVDVSGTNIHISNSPFNESNAEVEAHNCIVYNIQDNIFVADGIKTELINITTSEDSIEQQISFKSHNVNDNCNNEVSAEDHIKMELNNVPCNEFNENLEMSQACNNVINNVKDEVCTTTNIETEFENDLLVCDSCQKAYEDYCTNCGMLERILNSNTECTDSCSTTASGLPNNILEIRTLFRGTGVFALKIIPGGVIFGPCVRLSTRRKFWRIRQGHLIGSDNNSRGGNWMQYINCAKSISEQNLIAFQYKGELYYRSNRKILEGEELLLYFEENHSSTESDVRNIFACTFCCLGFSTKLYLVKHKMVCSYSINKKLMDEVLVQCEYCDISLEDKEYLEYHKKYCYKNSLSQCVIQLPADQAITAGKYPSASSEKGCLPKCKCTQCTFKIANDPDINKHNIFNCNTKSCIQKNFNLRYKRKKIEVDSSINKNNCRTERLKKKVEIDNNKLQSVFESDSKPHVEEIIEAKRHKVSTYNCSECDYSANYKSSLEVHMKIKHNKSLESQIELPTEALSEHTTNKTLAGETIFKCLECDYATCFLSNFEIHVNQSHSQKNTYKCLQCNFTTNRKIYLMVHVKGMHRKGLECLDCDFETNSEKTLNIHVNTTHCIGGTVYECSKCDYKTYYEENLKIHADSDHQKEAFKCEDCDFTTDSWRNMTVHIDMQHNKLLQYTICECQKEQESYKCPECDYKANNTRNFTEHVKYGHKGHKCSECDYVTSRLRILKSHMFHKHHKVSRR